MKRDGPWLIDAPVLGRDDLYRIDREASERFAIPALLLMEGAGRAAAEEILRLLERRKGTVRLWCGRGKNGGDGFVVARHLWNRGVDVTVVCLGKPEKYPEISFTNYEILRTMDVPLVHAGEGNLPVFTAENDGIIVDGILGIGLRDDIRGDEQSAVSAVNRAGMRVVSLDVPSGLDADTGRICGTAVRADCTISFGFAKKGFFVGEGPRVCGIVRVADIGYPRRFYGE